VGVAVGADGVGGGGGGGGGAPLVAPRYASTVIPYVICEENNLRMGGTGHTLAFQLKPVG
jgi:hypothetical protein